MNYNYHCLDCEKVALTEYADEVVMVAQIGEDEEQPQLPAELYEEFVLFETSHAMNPTPEELHEAIECPRCHGHNCEKTMYGSNITSYIKGYGWLDRKGAKRDMNRCKLKEDDPYAPYRVAGEVDHIDTQLKKEGQYDPKTKHFLAGNGKEMEKAVSKAVSTPTPND